MSNLVKLKEVVKIIGGGTPSKSEKAFYDNGTIKWATVGDMNTDLIVDTELKITKKAVKESSTNILSPDAIVIATRVGLGKVCYLESETAINQDLKGLLPNIDRLTKEYLYYFFKSISKYIIENGTGATVKGVKLDFINDINIPLPPLSEQQRIVLKLDLLFQKIDKSIELHQKNMDESDAFMGSVLNEVFGELEEKHENKKINEVVKEGGKTISTLDYPNLIYFSLEDIEAHSGKILKYQTASEANVKGTAVRFDSDCVLYSKLRPYLNKVTISKSEGCSTTELVVLRPKEDLDKYFLVSFLRSPNVVNFLHNDSMGAKMPRTNMKTFREMKIPIPPLSIQQKVVEYLDSVSEKMEKVKSIQKEKMESLKALKASILDKAFRGEL